MSLRTPEQYLVLDEPIVPGIYNRFERHLTQAQASGCVAVHVLLDAAWGDHREALRLYHLIVGLKMPVVTYCTKRAMGAGLIVFIAGTKREASPHAKFMIESRGNSIPPVGNTLPTPDNAQVIQLLLERGVLLSPKELAQFDAGKNLHFSSLEALACGIVHDIASNAPVYETARSV